VSDPESNPLRSLLSGIDLGPAWARSTTPPKTQARAPREDSTPEVPRRDSRDRNDRSPRSAGGGDRDGGRRFERRQDERGSKYEDRRSGPPQREEIEPAPGVRVQIHPDPQAVNLVGKEIHQVARVYSLFDIAQILLAQRERVRAVFEVEESRPAFFLGKLDGSLWLTREEAIRHFWQSDAKAGLFEEETIEVDPPTGNFQIVARCGMSGEWLGPPNFHAYQTNLRRIHRERFSNLPFEVYASRVRTERGEDAVNAWLETMKKRTRWRPKGDEEAAWIEDAAEAERAFSSKFFADAFEETRKADVSGGIPAKHISPSLLASLRMAGFHARKHPAVMIPTICRMLEGEHLPVFKREGKLFTGPARPHPVPADAILAERPSAMVSWLKGRKEPKLGDLWKAVLPEGITEAPQEWLVDLFWLLTQGHLLLFADDRIILPERRQSGESTKLAPTKPEPVAVDKRKRKRRTKKRKPKKRVGVSRRRLKLNPLALRLAKAAPDKMWSHQLRTRTLRRSQILSAREEES
jgi:hypothetical protein